MHRGLVGILAFTCSSVALGLLLTGKIDASAAERVPRDIQLPFEPLQIKGHLLILCVPWIHHTKTLVFLCIPLPQGFPGFFQVQALAELRVGEVGPKCICRRLLKLLLGLLLRPGRPARNRLAHGSGGLTVGHLSRAGRCNNQKPQKGCKAEFQLSSHGTFFRARSLSGSLPEFPILNKPMPCRQGIGTELS